MSNRPGAKKSSSQKVRAASNAGKGSSTKWIWVGIVAVVLANIVAFFLMRMIGKNLEG